MFGSAVSITSWSLVVPVCERRERLPCCGIGRNGGRGNEGGKWGGRTVYVSAGDAYVNYFIYEQSLPDKDQRPKKSDPADWLAQSTL